MRRAAAFRGGFLIERGEKMQKESRGSFLVAKTEPDKMLVFGWANVAIRKDGAQVEDLQGDVIDPEELEKAAYDHVLRFRSTGERHDPNLRSKGRLIESCVFTKEKQAAMGIPPGILDEAWWVGYKIDDPDAWVKIKSGDYKMFSVEGKGKREAIAKSYGEAKEAVERRRAASGVLQKSAKKIVFLKQDGSIIEFKKFNPYHDPKNGRFASGGGVKGRKSKYAPSPQRNKGGIQLKSKTYARLCGTLGTRFPGLEKGEIRKIRDERFEYTVKADGYGGFTTIDVQKIK